MHENLINQLDESVRALLAGEEAVVAPLAGGDADDGHSSQLRDLLQIAARLHAMPRPEFRARLRDELVQREEMKQAEA